MKKTATDTFPPPPPTPSAHKIELKYDSQGHNVLCNVAFNGSRII